MLHRAYQMFPHSAAARGEDRDGAVTSQQRLLARLLKGAHW
ncbi:MAG: hypothetical protein AVDCRST_MAG72-1028 [uncultured Nocardioidaceae bacterium]|uniref:Uncharacterized protein n=1 Tax=uncultured Nocardioidaceae bacterium TaxID=253824 RepID=A0A6J4LWA4_9ACTN|nr:MAG: hypothetical protein AVDCRST_MAG72-1028 [uncultured Nocardioidaceae bacterium]